MRIQRNDMASTGSFWFWFGGIWLAVGLPFVLIAGGIVWHELTSEERLAREGAQASGVVLVKIREGGRDGRAPSFRVQYRFEAEPAKVVRAEAFVSEEAWESYLEQEAVPVTYLPHFPRTSRIPGRVTQWVLPAIFGALGALLTILGGFVLLKARAMRNRKS